MKRYKSGQNAKIIAVISLILGIIILINPVFLHFFVATYLIVVGIIGLIE